MPSNNIVDVLIIGGGPAGLAIATGLARQLYTAIVFDSGFYRNRRTKHMHNVPTWDHEDPAAYRKKAHDDLLKRYNTIEFENINLYSATKTAEGLFKLEDPGGTVWMGRKLALAVGVQDVYPKIEGYGDCWARGIFHCLFCHGYEERNAPSAGILAVGSIGNPTMALHLARMAKRLAKIVTVYTNGDDKLAEGITKEAINDDNISVQSLPIQRLEKGAEGSSVVVHLPGGKTVTEGFLVHKPKTEINGQFVQQLGLELTEQGDIKTNGMFYETSVTGVFAAGDCATPLKAVTQAVAMGSFCAAGLVFQLQVPEPKTKAKEKAEKKVAEYSMTDQNGIKA